MPRLLICQACSMKLRKSWKDPDLLKEICFGSRCHQPGKRHKAEHSSGKRPLPVMLFPHVPHRTSAVDALLEIALARSVRP